MSVCLSVSLSLCLSMMTPLPTPLAPGLPFDATLVNKIVPCEWLASGNLEAGRLQLQLHVHRRVYMLEYRLYSFVIAVLAVLLLRGSRKMRRRKSPLMIKRIYIHYYMYEYLIALHYINSSKLFLWRIFKSTTTQRRSRHSTDTVPEFTRRSAAGNCE